MKSAGCIRGESDLCAWIVDCGFVCLRTAWNTSEEH
uniref:Uncharacterized protein n=1 Tax=Anopheles arabiensis TaxID=7173 RepID=A0A182IHY9_ANOAR